MIMVTRGRWLVLLFTGTFDEEDATTELAVLRGAARIRRPNESE